MENNLEGFPWMDTLPHHPPEDTGSATRVEKPSRQSSEVRRKPANKADSGEFGIGIDEPLFTAYEERPDYPEVLDQVERFVSAHDVETIVDVINKRYINATILDRLLEAYTKGRKDEDDHNQMKVRAAMIKLGRLQGN